MSTVFGKTSCTPWSRLSSLLAICLLIGGLAILVLDLGRPERLIIAMTHYNFQSVFAWNIFLYVGLVMLVMVYLWALFERGLNSQANKLGMFVFMWRLILTTGTGSIFALLVTRQFFDSAMMVPVFIVLSLVLGTAVFVLVCMVAIAWGQAQVEKSFILELTRLMALFIGLELVLVVIFHLLNLTNPERSGIEKFILFDGEIYSGLFWLGQIVLGSIVPLVVVFFIGLGQSLKTAMAVSILAIIGGLSQLYVTIIAGQVFPLNLFPDKEISSSFYDGVIAHYVPGLIEAALGVGGVAFAMVLLIGVMWVLPFLPYQQGISSGRSE
jgi:Ni/Fe-hydrogenase subunit HybB-like protein